jgi:2,4-dienoyl-CoA reductase-like NADH-dependent reductase (Old Yellow Enzyme family)
MSATPLPRQDFSGMPHLFSALRLRDVTLANRIGVSPMCQYCSLDGLANDWHFAHLTARAVGGAGLVFTEAAAVSPEGRISPQDLGAWSEKHFEPLERIARFIDGQGAVAGIQLAHAGRKASVYRPWSGEGLVPEAEGGWRPVAPSPIAFGQRYATPEELSLERIAALQLAFATAASRAYSAGFRAVEIHAAHGYLAHEFLSPLSNRRADAYGGSFDNRTRFLRECVEAVRRALPDGCPLFVRISSTDWTEGGWDIEQSVELARRLKGLGVDVVDCSSGGNVENAKVPVGPGYQVPFAERIKREADIATAAVGMITTPAQADAIIAAGQADLVLLARELLRDPYWPLRAARELGRPAPWPAQYLRAAPAGAPERAPAPAID